MRSGPNSVRPMFLWGFPMGALAATWLYWPVVQGTGLAFPFYVLAVPFLFALIFVPAVVARLHLWSWKIPLLQLAFLWSAYSALGILIVSDTIVSPFTMLTVARCAAFCAVLGGGIGTLVDIVGIDEGLLEFHDRTADRGTVKTVLSYSFKFFGIFSAIYGVVAKVGYSVLVERGATRWLPALILGTGALLCLPFLLHFLLPGTDREPARELGVR